MKKTIAKFFIVTFLAGIGLPALVLAQQNSSPKQSNPPNQSGQQFFNFFREGQGGGQNGAQQSFRPSIPGVGPYELSQMERLIKRAKRYGFSRVREILSVLQDEININDEEEGVSEDGEDILPLEAEDLREIQEPVMTALSALKEELNVSAGTARKTRQKKSLVKSAVKLLERIQKNLDREIKRMEEDERFREEEEALREQQEEQHEEQRKKFDQERRGSFRNNLQFGPQQFFQPPVNQEQREGRQPGSFFRPQENQRQSEGLQPNEFLQSRMDRESEPPLPAPTGEQQRMIPSEPVQPIRSLEIQPVQPAEPAPIQPSEPRPVSPEPTSPSSYLDANFFGAWLGWFLR